MAVTFLEPGGDADFNIGTTTGFWSGINSAPSVATDFVHGTHQKSLKFQTGLTSSIWRDFPVADTGSRISFYMYINAYGSATCTTCGLQTSGGANVVLIRTTSAGVIQLFDGTPVQIGTNGKTLSTGVWYRISLAYTITDTTHNRFELFVDGISSISVTNATLVRTGSQRILVGNNSGNATFDLRLSDIYCDNSSSLTDTGNIWVTAKRPFSNGTTNGFTTQIGAGGSGYGIGHAPQVNERPLSNTNGWSMIGAGSAITEEYNIESSSTGDINISTATIVDWLGWADMKSLAGETVQIILNGSNTAQAITSTETLYTAIKGSSTYPSGTGTDIGITTDTTLTTVSLYECGVIVAYIPSSGAKTSLLSTLSAG